MLLVTLGGYFSNLIIILFYRILQFFLLGLLMKRHKKGGIKVTYPQKYIPWDPKPTLYLKSNVSPVKICNKIWGSQNCKVLEEEV